MFLSLFANFLSENEIFILVVAIDSAEAKYSIHRFGLTRTESRLIKVNYLGMEFLKYASAFDPKQKNLYTDVRYEDILT